MADMENPGRYCPLTHLACRGANCAWWMDDDTLQWCAIAKGADATARLLDALDDLRRDMTVALANLREVPS